MDRIFVPKTNKEEKILFLSSNFIIKALVNIKKLLDRHIFITLMLCKYLYCTFLFIH